jgi:hypothetical protein
MALSREGQAEFRLIPQGSCRTRIPTGRLFSAGLGVRHQWTENRRSGCLPRHWATCRGLELPIFLQSVYPSILQHDRSCMSGNASLR